jgi:hypothetical protein
MTRLWDQLEGVYLAGEYGLLHYLGDDADAAFFRTAFGPEQRPALLKLVPENRGSGEEELARWRTAAELTHPHLLALLDCGRAEAGGESFLYAVFEYPDDNLATALESGPLSDDESRDVREAVADALRYLHEQGLVHGAIDAAHIVAVGDSIKLSSDTVRPVSNGGPTPADDLRALDTVLRTVEPEKPAPVAMADAPAAAPAQLKESAPAPVSESAEPAAPPLGLRLPKRSPAMPLLLAAVGAVAIAIVLATTHSGPPPEAASPAPASPAKTAPASPVVAKREVPPPVPAAAPASVSPARSEGVAHRAVPRDTWRVIAYTYNRRVYAEHKVQTINRKLPGFHAAVFAPRGPSQGPFFVALGGRMTREEAVTLQKKARSRGLPRDTFVRNYSE